MNNVLKALVGAACIAIIAIAAIQLRNEFFPPLADRTQAATPSRIAYCETTIAGFLKTDLAKVELTASQSKGTAIGLVKCDEYGLLDRFTKLRVRRSQIWPYFKALQDNPEVWQSETAPGS